MVMVTYIVSMPRRLAGRDRPQQDEIMSIEQFIDN
jgi:hypothetical protein